MLKVLLLVDHALATSGPHRNVVGSLNALSARTDVDLRLLTGRIDEREPYATTCEVRLGFEPHNLAKLFHNLLLLHRSAHDRDLIYVPSGLKAFLYAYIGKRGRKLAAGPNVTGIPLLMDPANPNPLMTMRMSDAWIESSEIRVQQCVNAGTPRSNIDVVPHAIDTERFSPHHRNRKVWLKYGLDPSVLKIVHVGRMNVEIKGVAQLIRSFQLLEQRLPDCELHLVLIGKKGPMLTQEHAKIRGVHAVGPLYGIDLVEALASADIFMGASRYETFWFAPLEAMACALPVVVSTAGAVPIMIPANGVQGVAVNIVDDQLQFLPDAPERLATAAMPLIADHQLREEIGHNARKHVIEHFSEQNLGENLMRIFRRLLR